jgi:hypothetical protein
LTDIYSNYINKRYADPTGVLKAVTNDFGQPVEIGSE